MCLRNQIKKRKKCLSYEEFANFKDNLTSLEKYRITWSHCTKEDKGYWWISFEVYPQYEQDIEKVKEMYGECIDFKIYTKTKDVCMLYVRAYKDFRRNR
jgi:hypothetical protein